MLCDIANQGYVMEGSDGVIFCDKHNTAIDIVIKQAVYVTLIYGNIR